MSKKMYFQSDGNGGFCISKQMLATISVLLTILGAIISITAYSVLTRADVDYLKEKTEVNTNDINTLNDKTSAIESSIAAISTKIDSLGSNIADVKTDIRELRNDLKTSS